MKRNFLLSIFAMLVMVLVTSCQKDEALLGEGEATVSFTVNTPELATRAFSEGELATSLTYVVYDAQGNRVSGIPVGEKEIHGRTTVDITLAVGNTYKVLFWAANENAPYTLDAENHKLSIDYSNVNSNDEELDAFYSWTTVEVSRNCSAQTVELKRPFAQLNIGTADFQLAANAGVASMQTAVKVTEIYNTLDFANGEVSGNAAVEFKLANIPAESETFPVAGNRYLAMNYLLVDAEKEVVEVVMTYTGAANNETRTFGSVPVQRNYRTNIYGNLLTQSVGFEVEIKPAYEDDFNSYYIENGTATVASAEGLNNLAQDIANGKVPSNTNIVLDGDIDLSTVTRSAVVSNWNPIGTSEEPFTGTLDGKNHTIKNLTIIENEAKEGKAYIGFFGYAEKTTIKNVTFENVNINIACLDIDHSQGHIGAVAGSLEGTSTIENVTIKGDIKVESTFDANGASRVAVVAGGNSYGNVTMKNVHVIANDGSYLKANNNVGALAGQLQGKSVFENCSSNIDVTGKKFFAGGIIGLAAGDQVFTNCHTTGDITITAGRDGNANDHYRVGGIAGGWADGKTNVCTLTNCSYTGNVSGTNADGSVATHLDYLGFVGRGYSLNNCEGSKVVIDGVSFIQKGNGAPFGNYRIVDAEGNEGVAAGDSEDLAESLAGDESLIYLSSGEYDFGNSVDGTQTEVSIVGNGIENTIVNAGETSNNQQPGVYATGKHLVFKDLTYVTPNNGYQGGFGHAASVTFINCKIIGQFYAHSGAPHTFIDCVIDPLTGYLYTYASDCVFEGCTFESSEGKALQVYEDASTGENTVSIKNCTFKAAKVAQTWDGKPVTAIDINSNGAIFNVTVENCTATGYGVGLNSGSDLWNIKANAQCVNLTIDGELKSLKGFGIVNGYYAVDNTYTVLTGEGFKTVATTVLTDGEKNVVVELANDIDLAGIEWPAFATYAAFVLDGKGHTIKNFTTNAVEEHGFSSTAMFTTTRKPTTIKNLVIEKATITGNGKENSHGAVLVACNYSDLTISGVTIESSTISNCDRTGGLITYLYFKEATVEGCQVNGCTINSIGTAGAILGVNNSNNFTMNGCKVTNTTVSSIEGSNKAGILIGTWQDAGTLTSEGNEISNSKAINAGVETNNEIGRHA